MASTFQCASSLHCGLAVAHGSSLLPGRIPLCLQGARPNGTRAIQYRQQGAYQDRPTERILMVALFQQEFVRNAFLAGTIVSVVTAVIGYFVILRAQAFAGEALADIGFAGATGAAVLGISSLLGMFFLALLAALGMGALGTRIRGRDVEIGMVLSFALGLGVLCLIIYSQSGTNAAAAVGILLVSMLIVTRINLLITLARGIATVLAMAFPFHYFLVPSAD